MKVETEIRYRKAKRIRRGFTLIELLTVITIIAILVGLLFPAIKMAINKASVAQARKMIEQTGAAFRAYFTEYSVWPTTSVGNVSFDLTTNLFKNAASITFLDVSSKSIGTSGVNSNKILDPWGAPYHCRVDGDFTMNNTVTDPLDGVSTITNGYAIWSDGPDGQSDTGGDGSALNRDDIKSW